MSNLIGTAKTKLYIGTAKAFTGTEFVASDFTTETWTEIDGTTNLGGAGDTAELITSNQIGQGRTRKMKGVVNAGQIQVVCDLDPADPGQIALIAAQKSRESFAFKVAFNDAPAGGTPSIRYFAAYVMNFTEQWDEANSIMKLNTTLEIDSNIVRVAAAEAEG
ncbi:hypothetical protein ACTDI4_18030 [Mesorhizobium sp. PUT5]|uniref:hypothetical protein n=1 Tax=Mesorhizobium sp. PUT5 TaxID=3454629 RepID=UPI003FA48644